METLKKEVQELSLYKLMVEEAGDMISIHRADDKVSDVTRRRAQKKGL